MRSSRLGLELVDDPKVFYTAPDYSGPFSDPKPRGICITSDVFFFFFFSPPLFAPGFMDFHAFNAGLHVSRTACLLIQWAGQHQYLDASQKARG